MLRNLNLKIKLVSAFLLVGLLSVVITGWQSFQSSGKTLRETAFDNLTAIRETKKRHIEDYFDIIRKQIVTFSEDRMVVNAMRQFKTAFHEIKKDSKTNRSRISEYAESLRAYYGNEFLTRFVQGGQSEGEIDRYLPHEDGSIILQYHYISNNPNPTGRKDNLQMAGDGSKYSQIHSKYHPLIRNYLKKFGYYDIFMVDHKTGDIVYTVSKEVDFATKILAGPYKDTNFSRVFKEAGIAHDRNFTKLVDYDLYAPSYDAPASFIASPIFDGDEKIGVLVFQMPTDEINRVMTGDKNWSREGLGETGETYIVGTDLKMRNDSRFLVEAPDRYFKLIEKMGLEEKVIQSIKSHSTSILFQPVRTEAAEDALRGNTDTKIILDYRDISVLSSYAPLDIEGLRWGIVSEIDEEEVFSPMIVLRNRILLIALAVSAMVAILGLTTSRVITRPVFRLIKGTEEFGKGDLSARVPITSKDEIGFLTEAFNKMGEVIEKHSLHLEELVENRTAELQIQIAERKQAEEKREKLIVELQGALTKIKTLRGLVPICAWCKKIRNDEGYWKDLEDYISEHSFAEFTHGICQECLDKVWDD
jgi:methyl-accepting chemotaxis protein